MLWHTNLGKEDTLQAGEEEEEAVRAPQSAAAVSQTPNSWGEPPDSALEGLEVPLGQRWSLGHPAWPKAAFASPDLVNHYCPFRSSLLHSRRFLFCHWSARAFLHSLSCPSAVELPGRAGTGSALPGALLCARLWQGWLANATLWDTRHSLEPKC